MKAAILILALVLPMQGCTTMDIVTEILTKGVIWNEATNAIQRRSDGYRASSGGERYGDSWTRACRLYYPDNPDVCQGEDEIETER